MLRCCAVLLLVGFVVVSVDAAAPRVVRCEPRPGSQATPPHLRFIRVEFDQDMRVGSHSWVGGGEKFPKLRGQPYWESPRIAVLPVELRPAHAYWLSVNNQRFRGFRSRDGEAAEPYEITFKTGAAGRMPPREEVWKQENGEATKLLRRYIDEYYSYRNLRDVDWDAVFEKHADELRAGVSPDKWAARAGELLAAAQDLHVSLQHGEQRIATHRRAVPMNGDVRLLGQTVPNWKQHGNQVASGRFPDGIGYLLIATWSKSSASDIMQAVEVLKSMKDCRGLILDVRPNSGGDEGLAQAFAGHFVEEPVVYAQQVYRDPQSKDGFTEPMKRTLEPAAGAGGRFEGRVAVLMGRRNMSSCEAFLLMMRQVPGCKLVGETSYGSSGNPQPYGLPNGVTVHLSSWKAMTAEGKVFEGKGIEPDIRVEWPKGEVASDPLLEAALEYVRAS